MTIVAVGIGLYVLVAALVVVSSCMISSRISEQEGLTEEWTSQEQAYARVATPVKRNTGKATRYA